MSENSWSEGGEYVAEGLTASSWSAASCAAKWGPAGWVRTGMNLCVLEGIGMERMRKS